MAEATREHPFLALPIEMQRNVVRYVPRRQLTTLQLASKHFLDLASARIYADLIFLLLLPESPSYLCKPEFRLGHALETMATSQYDYCQHIKTFSLHMTDRLGNEWNRKIATKFHWEEDATRFLNTLLHLVLRRATKLEGFWWMVPIELSEAVYAALAKSPALQNVSVRLDTTAVQRIANVPHPPSTSAPTSTLQTMPVQQSVSQFTNPYLFAGSSQGHQPPHHSAKRPKGHSISPFLIRDERRKFSYFQTLRQLEVMGIDDYGCIPEIAKCLRTCSTSLKSLSLSLSHSMVVGEQKPKVVETYDDPMLDDATGIDIDDLSDSYAPTVASAEPIQTPVAYKVDPGGQKLAQDSMLARIFGLEADRKEDKAVDRALKSHANPLYLTAVDFDSLSNSVMGILRTMVAEREAEAGGTIVIDTKDIVATEAFTTRLKERLEKCNPEHSPKTKKKSPKADQKTGKKLAQYGGQNSKAGGSAKSHSWTPLFNSNSHAENAFSGNGSVPAASSSKVVPLPPVSAFDELFGSSDYDPAYNAQLEEGFMPATKQPPPKGFSKKANKFPSSGPFGPSGMYPPSHPQTTIPSNPAQSYTWLPSPAAKLGGSQSQPFIIPGPSGQLPFPDPNAFSHGQYEASGSAYFPTPSNKLPILGHISSAHKSSWKPVKSSKYSNPTGKKKKQSQPKAIPEYMDESTASYDTESTDSEAVPKAPYFPAAEQKAFEGDLDVDMEHPEPSGEEVDLLDDVSDLEPVQSAHPTAENGTSNSSTNYNSSVSLASAPINRQSTRISAFEEPGKSYAPVTPAKETNDLQIGNGSLSNGKNSKASRKTRLEETMREYLLMKHGFSIDRLSLYLIPVKPSVLGRAIDLSALRSLALLSVGPQGAFWLLMSSQKQAGINFGLTTLQTDDVSLAFLKFVASLPSIENLFMLRRNKKDFDCTTSKVPATMDDIRTSVLRPHARCLKRLLILNNDNGDWDLDRKCVRLLAAKAKGLKELSFNIDQKNWHIFLQALPGFKSLAAMNVSAIRCVGPTPMQIAEAKESLVDALNYCPNLRLRYVGFVGYIFTVERRQKRTFPAFERHRSSSPLKGKGKAKGKAPANPWDVELTEEEGEEEGHESDGGADSKGKGKGKSKGKGKDPMQQGTRPPPFAFPGAHLDPRKNGTTPLPKVIIGADGRRWTETPNAATTAAAAAGEDMEDGGDSSEDRFSDIENEQRSVSLTRPVLFSDPPECNPRIVIFHKRVRLGRL